MRPVLFIALALLVPGTAVFAQSAPKAKTAPSSISILAPGEMTNQILAEVTAAQNALSLVSVPDVRIDVDLNNVPVRDALKQVFAQARQEYVADDDVPETARITVKARNAKLSTVLDLITQSAGVRWGREMRDKKPVFRIGKSVRSEVRLFTTPPVLGSARSGIEGLAPFVYRNTLRQEQATFTCPHCQEKVTMLRQRQQPQCATCRRTFQSDWQFCPVDGAKRPSEPGEWKHCPICGKPVDIDKIKEKQGTASVVPFFPSAAPGSRAGRAAAPAR